MPMLISVPDHMIPQKKKKKTRKAKPKGQKGRANAYALFCQREMASECCRGLSPRSKFKKCAQKWREKHSS